MKFVKGMAFALLLAVPSPLLAQSSAIAELTVKNNELQEQVRTLNGTVEDLRFQLLQMQERIRKMQEDNEFRFQELEDKHSNAGNGSKPALAKAPPGRKTPGQPAGKGNPSLGKLQPSEPKNVATGSDGKNSSRKINKAARRVLGQPPRNLGTLVFDENGNVVDSALGKPLDLIQPLEPLVSSSKGDGSAKPVPPPLELLSKGRKYFNAGDYNLAAKKFQQFAETYPDHRDTPEARFLLGESLFAIGDFYKSASVYLDAHNAYPKDKRGAETLLKLGLSMAGLNERAVACATYAEVMKQYPQAGELMRKRVSIEQKSAKCS